MNDKKPNMTTSLILICILFTLAGAASVFIIGIPLLFLAIYLLYKHNKKFNPIYKNGLDVVDINTYKNNTANELQEQRAAAEDEIRILKSTTESELQKQRAAAEDEIRILKSTTESELQEQRAAVENEIKNAKAKSEERLKSINKDIDNSELKFTSLQKEIDVLKNELLNLTGEIKVAYVSPYKFDNGITSEEYKNKLSILQTEHNEFIKSEDCIIFDGSITLQSKRMLNNNIKQLLRCFNSETSAIISGVTAKNVDSCRAKIQRTYETLNKLFVTDGIGLHQKCLSNKLDELTLVYNYQLKLEQEREQQRAIKEQMVEEEKVRREIEREKAKIEKEETQFKNEIQKLMTYLQKASDVEKQLYVDKINELETKVKLIEKDKENVLQREQNTRAGFVYIISNIGSFGENVYKIGMTRRLEPMDRVKELGDASVPFEFDVHAMIFSEDAPTLENILHKTFEKNAVNKVNPRKEFFNVSLGEVESVVKKHHNATVTFTEYAKAEQYRESLRLAQSN